MNRFQIILILYVATCFSDPLSAQQPDYPDAILNEWKAFFDQSYGSDYELVNGAKYVYLYLNSNEHPFLGNDRFYTGSVIINNRQYPDIEIKYDIYNQSIILNHTFPSGVNEHIILNNEFINAFELDGKFFRKYHFPETGTKFFQVIESDGLSSLYSWSKQFAYSSSSLRDLYDFSLPRKKAYLLFNGEIFSYSTKRSFLKLFPEEHRRHINRFIRINNIWLRKVPDNVMQQLINYCDMLIHQRNV